MESMLENPPSGFKRILGLTPRDMKDGEYVGESA
jgi:hypothetical protein